MMRSNRRIAVVVITIVLLTTGILSLAAQQPPGPGGADGMAGLGPDFMPLVSEYTGLGQEALMARLQEGATLADLMTANGASPEAFVSTVIDMYRSEIQARLERGELQEEQARQEMDQFAEMLHKMVYERNAFQPQPAGDRGPGPDGSQNGPGSGPAPGAAPGPAPGQN